MGPPARSNIKQLQLSVLDRLLLGDAPGNPSRAEQAHRLRDAVRRDLEALFNTRPVCRSWPKAMSELGRSTLSYGLRDLQSRTVISERQRDALRDDIRRVIQRFEPRLLDPVVEFIDRGNELDRSLRFRIHGRLVVNAEGEAVVYDTQVDPASRDFRIAAAERDREVG